LVRADTNHGVGECPQKILDAIDALCNDEPAMNGMIAARVLEYFQKQQQKTNELDESDLTSREKTILQSLVKGLSYKEIASDSFISIETLNSILKTSTAN